MTIHTVKLGETVFTIARKYATSPMKIIENNALTDPDRLSVGEELLILTPTRTYTVRGGDTLDRIARRFGVKKRSLWANNPYLAGTDSIYPGEVLAVKYDAPRGGIGAAMGYLFEEGKLDALRMALPYLSYVTVGSCTSDGVRIRETFGAKEEVAMIRDAGVSALVRISLSDCSDAFFTDKEAQGKWIDLALSYAKTHGYSGITVAAYRMAKEAPDAYAAFLLEARKRLLGSDSILFSEADANFPPAGGDFADGTVLMYEKCCLAEIPSFENGEQVALSSYAAAYESSRMFPDVSPFGYDNGKPVTQKEIRRLAYKTGSEIGFDEEKLVCRFTYPAFSGGKREEHAVVWESLRNVERKLALADELGYMGMALDVTRTPVAVFMMLHATFAEMSYPFLRGDE